MSWISDCNSVYFILKFAINVLLLTENGVKNIPILEFLYEDRKHSCLFFTVHGTVFNQCIKMHTIVSNRLSSGSTNCKPMYGCCERWLHAHGQAWLLVRAKPLPWWHRAEGGHAVRDCIWPTGCGLDTSALRKYL